MTPQHEVLIYEPTGELPPQIREALTQKGYASRLVGDVSTIIPSLREMNAPILLVNCGEDEQIGVNLVKGLVSDSALHEYPIILLGASVDGFEKVLGRYFQVATTLNSPFTTYQVLEAMAYVSELYLQRHSITIVIEEPPVKRAESKSNEAPQEELAQLQEEAVHEVYTQAESIPQLVFAELNRLNIIKRSFDAGRYVLGLDEDDLRHAGFFPTDLESQSFVQTVCADAGKWGRLHLCRVAFIVAKIIDVFEFDEGLVRETRSAPFLMALAFAGERLDLLSRDYCDPKHKDFRRQFASKIKDSAMKIALEVRQPETAKVVSTLARLIAREQIPSDDEVSLIASSIMAADIIDRACFESGLWNPRHAYRMLLKLKKGQIRDVHPAILSCVVKFLAEALATKSAKFLLPREIRRNPELLKEAMRIRDQKVSAEEKKVPIQALAPGMRLTQPIVAYDGRELLAGDLTLDQDLIWRLWQLSAIKPINSPAVVSKN